jgi:ribosome-binding factor A
VTSRRGRADAGAGRRYPRSARVNEVLREVLAETLRREVDADERLTMLTVTAVETDTDLRRARVLFASLTDEARAALEDHRIGLQATVARQVRLKWTPQLSFAVDPAVSTGQRVEDLLRQLRSPERGDGDADDAG